jgi:hypothetical protein
MSIPKQVEEGRLFETTPFPYRTVATKPPELSRSKLECGNRLFIEVCTAKEMLEYYTGCAEPGGKYAYEI